MAELTRGISSPILVGAVAVVIRFAAPLKPATR